MNKKYSLLLPLLLILVLAISRCKENDEVPNEEEVNEIPGGTDDSEVFFSDDFETGDLSKTENGLYWSTENHVHVAATPNGTLGLEFKYGPNGTTEDDLKEQRIEFGKGYSDLWIKYDLYVPENYHHRCPVKYELEVAEPGMLVGDTVYKVDQDGTILDNNYWGIVYDTSGNLVWVDQLWKYFLFLDGDYMKNQRTNVVSQVKKRNGYGANNKFFLIWQGEYGSLSTGNSIDLEYWCMDYERGSSYISSYLSVDQGTKLRNEGHTEYEDHCIIDKYNDAGKWMELIYHFKIASESDNDGVIHVIKNGVDFLNITDIGNHSDLGYNYFEHCYLLGASNSGYGEETTFYIDNVVFSTDSILPKE